MSLPAQLFDEAHAAKCELAREAIRDSGNLRLQVSGWSMLPMVWPGDTLTVESVEMRALVEGDIVLFSRDRRLFAHRLVAKGLADGGLVTRGDAMPVADPPLDQERVLGRVSSIHRDGRCFEPARRLRLSERAVAVLVRSSRLAARVVVGVHGIRRKWSN